MLGMLVLWSAVIPCGLLTLHAPSACLTVQFDRMHVSLNDMYDVSAHKQAKSVTLHVVRVRPCAVQVVWRSVSS